MEFQKPSGYEHAEGEAVQVINELKTDQHGMHAINICIRNTGNKSGKWNDGIMMMKKRFPGASERAK